MEKLGIKTISYSEGMNWVHYLEAEILWKANSILIRKLYRIHKYDNDHPETSVRYKLLKDDSGIVRFVNIGNRTFTVANPNQEKNYFSHKG